MIASVFLPKQIIQAIGYPLTDIQMCSEGGIGFTADIKGTRVKFFKLDTCWLCNQFFPTMAAYNSCFTEKGFNRHIRTCQRSCMR